MSSLNATEQARLDKALAGLRGLMLHFDMSPEDALVDSRIPEDLQPRLRAILAAEQATRVVDPLMVEDRGRNHQEWLAHHDRTTWYYWLRLRAYLLEKRLWPEPTVRSVDRATDRILGALEDPNGESDFDTRGLVVGYVQSGKTANYSALIAKAGDAGYRLIIVLTGVHNTLRRQTQRRLDAELRGTINGRLGGVGRLRPEKEWIAFTNAQLNGDFNPGYTSPTALTLTHPALMVTKKYATVLEKLVQWLDGAPDEIKARIPVLVIDDEADQASINTGGNRAEEDLEDEGQDDEASPTRINALIRKLLGRFRRVAYVAYTATPFANVLIDHEARDREYGADLYPGSFVVALPRPDGYYGAERIFGNADGSREGLDVTRLVPVEEIALLMPIRRADADLFEPKITPALVQAIEDFIVAGAARRQRGQGLEPATMLIHTSYFTGVQQRLSRLVAAYLGRLQDDWRYTTEKRNGIKARLKSRWESDFRKVTRADDQSLDVPFSAIEDHVGPFLEQIEVRQLNNISEDDLDYEREPNLKVIVIGGNRLSRGLTLEGLLVSFFVRPTRTYDTLMQMGRWFGYRDGYADLTRIYMTKELRGWFRDLANVEEELRDEIGRYEREDLTPRDLGVKIRRHPAMMVTSPLKMQGRTERMNISYAGQLVQTVTFPFQNINWLRSNIAATQRFLSSLGAPGDRKAAAPPVWTGAPASVVLQFLSEYQTDPQAIRVRQDLLQAYIKRQLEFGELTEWVVGVMGRRTEIRPLGSMDLHISSHPHIHLIERTRLVSDLSSLKAIVSPGDERLGLTDAQLARAEQVAADGRTSLPRALRAVRERHQGLLLIYPISKASGHGAASRPSEGRAPIYQDPQYGEDVIGVALAFPESNTAATVEYVVGSVGPGEY